MIKAKKNDWQDKVSSFIGKFFSILKGIVRFAWEFVMRTMALITFFFSFLLKAIADPSTPCVVAIVFFMFVSAIAASQWWAIGVWAGKVFGVKSGMAGVSSGLVGSLFGFGINIYQLSPQLWKLRKDVAEVYGKLEVDPNFENDTEDTLDSRKANWLSYDHRNLKGARLVSYGLEASIVLGYCTIAQSLAFGAIIQATISLLLPEKSLELLANTVSLMGAVSENISSQSEDESTNEPRRQPRG